MVWIFVSLNAQQNKTKQNKTKIHNGVPLFPHDFLSPPSPLFFTWPNAAWMTV
jgi:hypothetical protein